MTSSLAVPAADLYLVSNFIQPVEVGQQIDTRRMELPLHITLAQWFVVQDVDELQAGLHTIAQDFEPLDAKVGQEALYGANRDVPVNIIENRDALLPLHLAIVQHVIGSEGSFLNGRWFGENYGPHVTHKKDVRKQEGDIVPIHDFHLIRRQPNARSVRHIVSRYVLGGEHE